MKVFKEHVHCEIGRHMDSIETVRDDNSLLSIMYWSGPLRIRVDEKMMSSVDMYYEKVLRILEHYDMRTFSDGVKEKLRNFCKESYKCYSERTPEEEARARDWILTEQKLFQASCTHKERDGTSALIEQSDDLCHCTICGANFPIVPKLPSELQEVQKQINTLVDAFKILGYSDTDARFIANCHKLYGIGIFSKE